MDLPDPSAVVADLASGLAAALPVANVDFEFKAGPHAAGALVVLEMEIDEKLSSPFSVTVRLVPRPGVVVEPDVLLGEEATLSFHAGGSKRHYHGILASMDYSSASENGTDHSWFVARIVPTVWKLSQSKGCRIFQNMTAPEIVKQVLNEWGISFSQVLLGEQSCDYVEREYCVQYRESDLDFVSRLLEEEGIFYLFEHHEDEDTLVMLDDITSCHELPNGARIVYREPSKRVADEHVNAFQWRGTVRPTAVSLRDFDYARPNLDMEAKSTFSGEGLEVYDYPGCYTEPWAGKNLCEIRLQELRVQAGTGSGASTSRRLAPGWGFELDEHPMPALNGEYLVLSVRHQGWMHQAFSSKKRDPERPAYENEFVCLRKGVPYRPPRGTPRPVIPGPQTAIVVGPEGEEIFTDEHGRIKVQFHWDREGKKDENSSCWVRVSQAWAGAGWGALYLPRIGHEVVVEFLEGDPDRPVVTGSVYNGVHYPPVALPQDKTKSTLRSSSSPGGHGSNELLFEDAAGMEQVYLHAQKDLEVMVLNDKVQEVGGNETLVVEKDRSRTVNGNQSLTVNKDDTTTILQNQSLRVEMDRQITVHGDHVETIAGNRTVDVELDSRLQVMGSSQENVALDKRLSIGTDSLVTVGGRAEETVGGAKDEEVTGNKTEAVGGSKSETIAGSRDLRVGGDLQEKVGQSRTMKVGQSFVVNVGGTMRQTCSAYTLHAKEITIAADDEFSIKVGGATLTIKGGQVLVNGSAVQVTSSGPLVLKGAPVTGN